MASKKDRLSRRIRDEVNRNTVPGESNMSGFVDDVASRRSEVDPEAARSARSVRSDRFSSKKSSGEGDFRVSSKKRESVYNITGDIRLEDYVDSKEEDPFWKKGRFYRFIGSGVLLLVLLMAVWALLAWLLGPSYKLGVAPVELTENNIDEYVNSDVILLGAGKPIHIRFQWEEGKLETDYLKILIEKNEGGFREEEAELGRRPPRTANYIYFYGPLDPGEYRIEVLNRDGKILKARDVRIR